MFFRKRTYKTQDEIIKEQFEAFKHKLVTDGSEYDDLNDKLVIALERYYERIFQIYKDVISYYCKINNLNEDSIWKEGQPIVITIKHLSGPTWPISIRLKAELNLKKYLKQYPKHYFHIVDPSPWPISAAIAALLITLGGTATMHDYSIGPYALIYGIIYLLFILFSWFKDIIIEGSIEGRHTRVVKKNLRLGFKLFIVSEVMFFFGFFWAYFHSSLSPSIFIGGEWPPLGIKVLDPFEIPFINTIILLVSGASITWGHIGTRIGMYIQSIFGLILTAFFASIFLLAQLYEYTHCTFNISDGIYGSIFFMLTGFHGFHVFLGFCMIFVSILRLTTKNLSTKHHLGLEFTVWYWHFVDIVWILVYIFVYIWGSYFF